jgi:hypothetical protein
LIIAGTPRLGDTYAVELDIDASGRVTDFQLDRFSPFEIAAVLGKKFGEDVEFQTFLTIWSLIDGVVGLYPDIIKQEILSPSLVRPCLNARFLMLCNFTSFFFCRWKKVRLWIVCQL